MSNISSGTTIILTLLALTCSQHREGSHSDDTVDVVSPPDMVEFVEQKCVPECEWKACGPDGCGGECGTCGEGWSCQQSAHFDERTYCTTTCELACEKLAECGTVVFEMHDECFCGECLGSQDACEDGVCVCVSDCDYADCGDDGCGGTCGECEEGMWCTPGRDCIDCYPSCSSMECGLDGCGNECGDCEQGFQCVDGACVETE